MTQGTVYLIGSNQGSALTAAVARSLAPFGGKSTIESCQQKTYRTPRVAVSYAAMSQNADGLSFMTALTAKLFGPQVRRFSVPGEGMTTSDKEARGALDGVDVVFMVGGDPVVGARLFVTSGADAWLRDARERGASFIGVSAGAIMLSSCWASWPDEPPPRAMFDGGVLVPCTRVAGNLVVDCHAEDENWCELKLVRDMLLAEDPTSLTSRCLLGLPHGGGVVIDADGMLEPIGKAPFVLSEPNP